MLSPYISLAGNNANETQLYRASHVLLDPIRRNLYDRELAGGRVGYPQLHRSRSRLKDSWKPERDGRDWPIPRRRGSGVW
jgi:hypothetical protein